MLKLLNMLNFGHGVSKIFGTQMFLNFMSMYNIVYEPR
jgi:hypothetical protein